MARGAALLARAALYLAAALGGPAVGQEAGATLLPAQGRTPFPEFPLAQPQSPVLTLDQERLFAESAFGRRVAAEIDAASRALARENRAIEAELQAEERALTERRSELPAQEFRALADAFDEKAVGFRRSQDAKARALQRRDEAERQAFLRAALPILADLLAELGAVALLDDRAVLLSSESIDVTDRAIERIDTEIGAGAELSPPGPIVPDLAAPMPAPSGPERQEPRAGPAEGPLAAPVE
jgi:Skp family chaperone for outer membrane proteins